MPGISLPLELPVLEHSDSFRLFQLYVGDNEGDIEGQLLTHELSEYPDYSALSHVWGTGDNKKTVIVDGRNVEIRQNLYQFLTALRGQAYSNPSKYPKRLLLWIDVLCIDQSSIPERNKQVQLMGKIFQSARSVIAYVGPFEDSLALSVLDGTAGTSRLAPGRNEQIRLLRTLGENQYWTRTWIVTECLCAKKLYLLSDTDVLSEKVLYQALNHYISEKNGKSKFDIGVSSVPDFARTLMWTLLSMRRSSKVDRDLLSLVDKFRANESQEPHDKVFAFIPLADPPAAINVDYTVDLATLFYQVITAHEGTREWSKVEGLRKALRLQPSDIVLRSNHPNVRSLNMLANFKYICRIGIEHQFKAPSALSLSNYFKSAAKWSLVLPDEKNVPHRESYILLSGDVKAGDVLAGFHGQAPLIILRGQEKFKVVGVADVDVHPSSPQDRRVGKRRKSVGAQEQLDVSSFANIEVDWDQFRIDETVLVDQPTWVDLYWRAATRDPAHRVIKNPKAPPAA